MEMNVQIVNLFGKITVGLGWLVLKTQGRNGKFARTYFIFR